MHTFACYFFLVVSLAQVEPGSINWFEGTLCEVPFLTTRVSLDVCQGTPAKASSWFISCGGILNPAATLTFCTSPDCAAETCSTFLYNTT